MTQTQTAPPERSARTRINTGLGRLLIFVYGLFALSAGARAGVQIATKFDVAPMAYILSAISAVIYLVATVCLARSTPMSRRIAIVSCTIELAGVIAVGTWSLLDRAAFPDLNHSTVWSSFGSEYAFFPLFLPILGLWWVWRAPQRETASSQISA
jgi:hypothetical protein